MHFSTVLTILRYELWFIAGGLALIVAYRLLTGGINTSGMLNEKGSGSYSLARLQLFLFTLIGAASMSRFQFLVFTFVVVLMWIYLFFAKGGGGMPPIDKSVLALLGISGASYVVSKGIQKSHETEASKAEAKKAEAEAEAEVKKAEVASGKTNP